MAFPYEIGRVYIDRIRVSHVHFSMVLLMMMFDLTCMVEDIPRTAKSARH